MRVRGAEAQMLMGMYSGTPLGSPVGLGSGLSYSSAAVPIDVMFYPSLTSLCGYYIKLPESHQPSIKNDPH
jgi:hypothetical protein